MCLLCVCANPFAAEMRRRRRETDASRAFLVSALSPSGGRPTTGHKEARRRDVRDVSHGSPPPPLIVRDEDQAALTAVLRESEEEEQHREEDEATYEARMAEAMALSIVGDCRADDLDGATEAQERAYLEQWHQRRLVEERREGEYLEQLECDAEEEARRAQPPADDVATAWNTAFPWAGPAPTLIDLTGPDDDDPAATTPDRPRRDALPPYANPGERRPVTVAESPPRPIPTGRHRASTPPRCGRRHPAARTPSPDCLPIACLPPPPPEAPTTAPLSPSPRLAGRPHHLDAEPLPRVVVHPSPRRRRAADPRHLVRVALVPIVDLPRRTTRARCPPRPAPCELRPLSRSLPPHVVRSARGCAAHDAALRAAARPRPPVVLTPRLGLALHHWAAHASPPPLLAPTHVDASLPRAGRTAVGLCRGRRCRPWWPQAHTGAHARTRFARSVRPL
nr:translation initiation factor IF-2-like [Aegilops tauschii subsp. strangulata]